ncbi:MAG: ATP-binding protein [Elusimicrobiales bacterium]|nr:ATP-binding protein [Elusimicrobiales bacterium]
MFNTSLNCYKCKIEKLNLLIKLEKENVEKENILKILGVSKDLIKTSMSLNKKTENKKDKNYISEIKILKKYFEIYFYPICVCDINGNIIIYNKMFNNELLNNKSQNSNLNINEIIPEIKFITNKIDRTIKFEIQREINNNKKIFNVKVDSVLIDNLMRNIFFFEDITEEKIMQEKYFHAQKMEAIGRLASGIAHDFNNILGVIMGYSTFILENIDDNFPYKQDIEEIVKAAERAGQLTKHILSFSRKQPLDKKFIKISEFIKSVEKIIKRIVGENIEIIMNLEAKKDEILMNDTELEQILFNLLINSKDAMPNGGKIKISTYNSKVENCEFITISIEDNGKGMDEETKKKIFKPFFTTKEKGKGTGLGLTTVFNIVKKYKGKIDFESKLNKGTKFMIHLPILCEEKKVKIICLEQSAVYEKGNGENILLVDDEIDLLKINKRFLEENGYKVLIASNIAQAKEIITKNKDIEIIIIDLVLPDGNAVDFINSLNNNNINFIITSGYLDCENQKKIIETNYIFLPKPYSAKDLFKFINNLIHQKKNSLAK